MRDPGQPSARCRVHAESAASFTCPRCGNFGCRDCERRRELDSAPMCPSCWALQAPVLEAAPSSTPTWQTAGLVLGALSLIPCCPITLASLIVNIVALVKSSDPQARPTRWKPLVGLLLTCGLFVLQVLFVALYNVFAHSGG